MALQCWSFEGINFPLPHVFESFLSFASLGCFGRFSILSLRVVLAFGLFSALAVFCRNFRERLSRVE